MTDNDLNDLALRAWKDAFGDALTAVKMLRDATGLDIREAAEQIQKTAHQVGGKYNLRLVTGAEAVAFAEAREQQAAIDALEDMQSARLVAHRAARGVRKVRGAK